jgi:hypothetical protein
MLRASGPGDLPTAAELLAANGIPVFPCVPGGKQPLTKRGFHDATGDVDHVRSWWRHSPDANIGIPTGGLSEVVVVDVDVHGSGTGFAAFERAGAANLVSAWGWLVRTPSGGLHAYFRPASLEQRSWQVPSQHVDFRGDGGYIVAPPSTIAGADGQSRAYQVIAVAQHRPRPLDADALRAFLEPPRPAGPPASFPALGSRPDKLATWVANRPEGARNHGLFWAACRMAESGHTFSDARLLLGDAAQVAGLSEQEAITTIRSAYRSLPRLGSGTGSRPTQAIEAVGL